jgi:hypothetical protein
MAHRTRRWSERGPGGGRRGAPAPWPHGRPACASLARAENPAQTVGDLFEREWRLELLATHKRKGSAGDKIRTHPGHRRSRVKGDGGRTRLPAAVGAALLRT